MFSNRKLKRLTEIDFIVLDEDGTQFEINKLIKRLELAENFILESRSQNKCTCDGECEVHLPLVKKWHAYTLDLDKS